MRALSFRDGHARQSVYSLVEAREAYQTRQYRMRRLRAFIGGLGWFGSGMAGWFVLVYPLWHPKLSWAPSVVCWGIGMSILVWLWLRFSSSPQEYDV